MHAHTLTRGARAQLFEYLQEHLGTWTSTTFDVEGLSSLAKCDGRAVDHA